MNEQLGLTFPEVTAEEPHRIEAPDADLMFYPACFNTAESERIFKTVYHYDNVRVEEYILFSRKVRTPRRIAWYGDPGAIYRYSGLTLTPNVWTPTLLEIKQRVEEIAGTRFNGVLINLYRDGKDQVAWHADDEPELGPEPVVASVSFGAERLFQMKHRTRRDLHQLDIPLWSGSLLIMRGKTQQYWLHRVPQTFRAVQPRINFTFRDIKIIERGKNSA